MHRSPWPEYGQLCGSEPFRLFCKSPLPTADQRVICRGCGLEVDESGHLPAPARAPVYLVDQHDQFGDPLREYDLLSACPTGGCGCHH